MSEDRGRVLADALGQELQPRAARFRELAGRPATLGIIAGDDAAAARFVAVKEARFSATGLAVRSYRLGADVGHASLSSQLAALNADPRVDGIFVQYPLPGASNAQEIADAVAREKDVDGGGSASLGCLLAGRPGFVPATPAAVVRLLEDQLGELRARSIVVVGGPGSTELCIALLVIAAGGTACVLEPADAALADAAAGADAVIIADALPPGDALRHIRNGAVLIDAAYARPPRPPGWLPPRALERVGAYLPQYRNVGPLTVALLIQATLHAASRLNG